MVYHGCNAMFTFAQNGYGLLCVYIKLGPVVLDYA